MNSSANIVFPSSHQLKEDDDDIDNFEGFDDNQSLFGQWNFEDDIIEDEEKLLEAFLSIEDRPELTLADIIVDKMKEKDAEVPSGAQPAPKLVNSIIELYKDGYFIKLLIEKEYALTYGVLDALVLHFMKSYHDSREMPVIWHQSLLAFAQRYKNELTKEDKDYLKLLVERQRHKLVTPEILRELNNSRNRGEKDTDPMSILTPLSIQEDRFGIPDLPMDEDYICGSYYFF